MKRFYIRMNLLPLFIFFLSIAWLGFLNEWVGGNRVDYLIAAFALTLSLFSILGWIRFKAKKQCPECPNPNLISGDKERLQADQKDMEERQSHKVSGVASLGLIFENTKYSCTFCGYQIEYNAFMGILDQRKKELYQPVNKAMNSLENWGSQMPRKTMVAIGVIAIIVMTILSLFFYR